MSLQRPTIKGIDINEVGKLTKKERIAQRVKKYANQFTNPHLKSFESLDRVSKEQMYSRMVDTAKTRISRLKKSGLDYLSNSYTDLLNTDLKVSKSKVGNLDAKYTAIYDFISSPDSQVQYLQERQKVIVKKEKERGLEFSSESERKRYWQIHNLLDEMNISENLGSPEFQRVVRDFETRLGSLPQQDILKISDMLHNKEQSGIKELVYEMQTKDKAELKEKYGKLSGREYKRDKLMTDLYLSLYGEPELPDDEDLPDLPI